MPIGFVDAEQANHRVQTMCRLLRVSRSGYYAWRRRELSPWRACDLVLAAEIAVIHDQSDQTYGVPRIHADLSERGVKISRRRVARLLRELGREGVSRRRRRRSTTRPGGARPVAADSSAGASLRPARLISCGGRTSPTCPPGRAGCTSPCW